MNAGKMLHTRLMWTKRKDEKMLETNDSPSETLAMMVTLPLPVYEKAHCMTP